MREPRCRSHAQLPTTNAQRLLKDSERALVWIDGRFAQILGPGLHALWTTEREIRVEVLEVRTMQLVHAELPVIVRSPDARAWLEVHIVEPGHAGIWFHDGAYQATLGPGTCAFWKDVGKLRLHDADLKEQVLDVSGQDVMTARRLPDHRSAAVGDGSRRAARAA